MFWAKAGLKPYDPKTGHLGDIIVAVNGKRVESLTSFVGEIDRAGVDTVAELTVLRNGQQQRVVKVNIIDLRK